MYEHFYLDRIRKICDLKADNGSLVSNFAGFERTHFAPYHHFAHLAPDFLDVDTLLLEITAKDDIGIVRTL